MAPPGRNPGMGRPCMQGLQACNRASAQPTAIQSGMACRQGITYKAKYSIIVSIVKYRILYYLIAGMAYRPYIHIKVAYIYVYIIVYNIR